jgi:hypothetical protein
LARVPGGGKAVHPLRLIGVAMAYCAVDEPAAMVLTTTGLDEQAAGAGVVTPFDDAGVLNSWRSPAWQVTEPPATCRTMDSPTLCSPRSPGDGAHPAAAQSWSSPLVRPGARVCRRVRRSRSRPATPRAAIPAVATAAYLSSTGESVDPVVGVTVNGAAILVKIVAAVSDFPTLTTHDDSALIVHLSVLSDAVALQGAAMSPVYTWWLHTAQGAR